MKSRIACSLVLILAVSVLTGCGTFRTIGDFFNVSAKKTKIQGERISIIATEGQLASDPQLAAAKMDFPPRKARNGLSPVERPTMSWAISWPTAPWRRSGAFRPEKAPTEIHG